MRSIEETPTKDARTVAALPLSSISTRAVDRIYERCKKGRERKRPAIRKPTTPSILRAGRGRLSDRLHPDVVPIFDPWIGVERVGKKGIKAAATRAEAYALAAALKAIGKPHLGAAALICSNGTERPEHVVGLGEMTWADWRPPQRPKHVQVRHPKTGGWCGCR